MWNTARIAVYRKSDGEVVARLIQESSFVFICAFFIESVKLNDLCEASTHAAVAPSPLRLGLLTGAVN